MAAKPITKSEILSGIATKTGLSRKQVSSVLEELAIQMRAQLKKVGLFAPPSLGIKVLIKHKPATKAGVKKNPFKPGEMMNVKAKPASKGVKIRALKALKDAVK
jgi:nucleoid DNA-binding protein